VFRDSERVTRQLLFALDVLKADKPSVRRVANFWCMPVILLPSLSCTLLTGAQLAHLIANLLSKPASLRHLCPVCFNPSSAEHSRRSNPCPP
jgi:hypothetical protein